jgi:uridylate kinase
MSTILSYLPLMIKNNFKSYRSLQFQMKKIVISVGGSAINPGKIDQKFLENLKKILLKASKKHKIIIITGGGHLAREYINALSDRTIYVRDVMGIHCTQLNAKLVATYIKKCNQDIPKSLEEINDLLASFNIVVCGGLRPGTTSDGTTASIADYLDADIMINMTNVKGLYSKDPNKNKDAKLIKNISHKHFKIFMDKVVEKPGQHFILDSQAAKICRDAKRKVIIIRGVKTLEKLLSGKTFIGTTIT